MGVFLRWDMKDINKSFTELRDAINNSIRLRNEVFQKSDQSWDRLWAALDALEDAQQAIDAFAKSEHVSYLELYGLLQAFYVQQDSVSFIMQTVIDQPRINWEKDEPKLNEIRSLRNETTGHPADINTSKGKAFCNIDRSSISKMGFRYVIWDKTGAHSKKADLDKIIQTQENEITRLVKATSQKIIKNDKAFIEQFSGEKLKDTYAQISHYQFEKLYLFKNSPQTAKIMFNFLVKVYKQLRAKLEERFGDFGSTINAPGLKIVIDEIDELLERLGPKLSANTHDLFDLNVYVESLEAKWEELGGMINEIDEKFKLSGDKP